MVTTTQPENLKLLEEIEDQLDLHDAIEALKEAKIKDSIPLEKFIATLMK